MAGQDLLEKEFLGDALEQIVDAEKAYYQAVTEQVFEQDVAPLLQNVFDQENLRQYEAYAGELTKPLRVVDNNNTEEELFLVPALVQTPRTSVVIGDGMSAEHLFRSLSRDDELGMRGRHYKVRDFLSEATKTPDYAEHVIKPIQAILQRYGLEMTLTTETPKETPDSAPQADTGDAFTEEYED